MPAEGRRRTRASVPSWRPVFQGTALTDGGSLPAGSLAALRPICLRSHCTVSLNSVKTTAPIAAASGHGEPRLLHDRGRVLIDLFETQHPALRFDVLDRGGAQLRPADAEKDAS